jgi:hypothetical protein
MRTSLRQLGHDGAVYGLPPTPQGFTAGQHSKSHVSSEIYRQYMRHVKHISALWLKGKIKKDGIQAVYKAVMDGEGILEGLETMEEKPDLGDSDVESVDSDSSFSDITSDEF